MKVDEIQEIINKHNYWDAQVVQLDNNHFSDEVTLKYDMVDHYVIYHFIGCYKTVFDHLKNYPKIKSIKNMTKQQLPYYLQSVKIGNIVEEEIVFITCKINMFPLSLEIWCNDITVSVLEKK